MSRIVHISTIIMLSLIIAGCQDILNQPPDDAVTSDEFFNTGDDLEAYTNDLYSVLPTTSV